MAVGAASGKKWGPSSSSFIKRVEGEIRVGSRQATKRWAEWVIGIISPYFLKKIISLAIYFFPQRQICEKLRVVNNNFPVEYNEQSEDKITLVEPQIIVHCGAHAQVSCSCSCSRWWSMQKS